MQIENTHVQGSNWLITKTCKQWDKGKEEEEEEDVVYVDDEDLFYQIFILYEIQKYETHLPSFNLHLILWRAYDSLQVNQIDCRNRIGYLLKWWHLLPKFI